MTVLISYKQCLLNKFKTCEKESVQIRGAFKDQLLDELSVRYVNVIDDEISSDEAKDEMIYYMCGYLLKTRDSIWTDCDESKKGLISKYEDLLKNFLSAEYNAERSHGGLTFATVNFFKIFQKV